MANNHDQFIEFNEAIYLHSGKKSELQKNRDALREKITKFFNEEKVKNVNIVTFSTDILTLICKL